MDVPTPARTANGARIDREAADEAPRSLIPATAPALSGHRETGTTAQAEGSWHQALHSTLGVVDAAVPDGRPEGTIRTFQLGHLRLATLEGDALRLRMAPRPIPQGDDFLVVMLMDTGVATVEQDDHRAVLPPGAMVFTDMARPRALEFTDSFRAQFLVLSRRLIGLREDQFDRLVVTPIRPDTTMSSLGAAFLAQLVDTAADCPEAAGMSLTRSAIDLLALLAEEQLSLWSQTSPGPDRLLQIKKFVEQHIDEPDLTPQTIARANSISVRYLHKLFQADGETVGQWIQRCRLQKCRSELAGLDATKRSISAVAHRWGFTSASHFSRAFRSLYGISPAEWRDPGRKSLTEPMAGTGAVAA
ncbi:helix-turn-helix domain-containing protein [Streptomyces sp900105755]|uniref:helix-turn-helix domain-containing protein n=1 Tax=Streptomyces sp. 900105755 TaxID=3154389 RepID=UPI00332A1B51